MSAAARSEAELAALIEAVSRLATPVGEDSGWPASGFTSAGGGGAGAQQAATAHAGCNAALHFLPIPLPCSPDGSSRGATGPGA